MFSVVLTLLAACSDSGANTVAPIATQGHAAASTPTAPAATTPDRATRTVDEATLANLPDFPLEAYQGAEQFGGKQSTFLQVFAQGQPIVLNFWAGRCPPCRGEMPAFQKVADEYAGEVMFVGIDVGEFIGLGSRDDARMLLAELDIRYPVAVALDASPIRLFQVQGMPTTFFLNRDGTLLHRQTGPLSEDRLRSLVDTLAAR